MQFLRLTTVSFHLRAIYIHVSSQHFKIFWLVLIQDALFSQLVQNGPQLLGGTEGNSGGRKNAQCGSIWCQWGAWKGG